MNKITKLYRIRFADNTELEILADEYEVFERVVFFKHQGKIALAVSVSNMHFFKEVT